MKTISKFLVSVGAIMLATMAIPAVAQDLSANNWRVFNIDTSVPKLWDINKAEALSTGGVQFPFQTSTGQPWDGTGWFTAYLTNQSRYCLTF
jgi:hypothetical protein